MPQVSTIYCLGEILLDMIYDRSMQVDAKPGGAMLNSAVSLGRLGRKVQMIGYLSEDDEGRIIKSFLRRSNVNTKYCVDDKEKTRIALAILDENKNAKYTFYKTPYNIDYLISIPKFSIKDYLLYGSSFSWNKLLKEQVSKILDKAIENNTFVLYDPNFRTPHLQELPDCKSLIIENISKATLVRGSDEDFKLIANAETPEEAFVFVSKSGCNSLVYTTSNKAVHVFHNQQKFEYKIPPLYPISTIGAGDTFNAGILYCLDELSIPFFDLNMENWDYIIRTSIKMAQQVCLSYDNYIDEDFKV